MRRRANQRPIRTRPPGRRRPVRWIDAFSAGVTQTVEGGFTTGVMPPGSIVPAAGPSTLNFRELVVGDLDTEWADANEVLLERVVGDIRVSGYDIANFERLGGVAWNQLQTLVRMGIVLVEDTDEDSTPEPPGLWTADDLADGEWLWLWQLGSPQNEHVQVDDVNAECIRVWNHDYHLDLRVKRKLGRRDRLVLCHEFVMVGGVFLAEHAVDVQPLLRALVSTK